MTQSSEMKCVFVVSSVIRYPGIGAARYSLRVYIHADEKKYIVDCLSIANCVSNCNTCSAICARILSLKLSYGSIPGMSEGSLSVWAQLLLTPWSL